MANTDFSVLLKAELDRAGIDTDLKKVQEIVKKYHLELTPDLQTASLKNQFKSVCKEMANDFNKAFNANVSSNDIFKVYENKAKQLQQTLQQANKIQLSFDTGNYQSKVDSLVARTNQWVNANGEARISTESLQTALSNLGIAYNNLNSSGGNTVANQQALIEAEKALDAEVKRVQSSVTSMNATMAKSSAVDSLRQKIQQFYDINTASHGRWGNDLKNIMSQLANGAEVPIVKLKELEKQFINIQNSARQTGKLGLSFFDTIKQGMQKFSYWTSSTFLVMKAVTEIKDATSFAKEMDSALTNINYTMDVTKSQLTDIGNSSIQMAKDLKTSASNILGAVTLYANAKETADSILKKSEAAIMLGNVTGMSGQESAKALQSVMNQFELTQDDLMYISDTIQKVSQNMAYDFSSGIEEIVGGIERSGSVAKAAGLDLNEYASMLGLVIEKTGLSGETIGTAYRTILTRITKASKIEGTSDEDISKAETALKAVGVQVRSTAGEFRDMTDIMKDLGKVWNNLNDVQQANISYEIAGTRQTNIVKTLLGYWTDYEDLATKAGNAAGTTLENQSKYEETLDAKTKALSSTMQSFWHNLIGAEEANGALVIFQKVATVLDTISSKLGSLGTIGLGAGIFAGFKNIGIFKTIGEGENTKVVTALQARRIAQEQLNASIAKEEAQLQADIICLKKYEAACLRGNISTEQFDIIMSGASDSAKNFAVSTKGAAGSTDVFVAKQKAAQTELKATATAAKGTSTAMKALSIAGNMIAMWAITEGIQLAAKLVDKLIVTTEELKEAADNAIDELNNLQSETDSLNQELTTTRDRITELENKPSLSFIEQEELQKLRDASSELERQIELNKTLLNVQEGKTRDSALDYLNKQTQYEGYGGWDMSQVRNGNARYGTQNVGTIFQGNQLEVAQRQLQEYENIAKRKENVEKRITSFKMANPDETKYTQEQKDALTNLQFELQSYDSTLKALNNSLYEVIPNLDAYKNVLNPDYDQSYINFIDQLIDGYNQLFGDTSGTKTEKFDDIWNSDDFKTYKSELESLAKEGKLDASVLESNEQYKKLLEETGATAEQTAQHINSLVSAEQGTANINETDISFTDIFSSLPIDKLEEYIALVKSGTIDENTIGSYEDLASAMTKTGISAEDAIKAIKEFGEANPSSIELTKSIQESYDVLKSVKEEFKNTKQISLDTLSSIVNMYPELTLATSQYAQGLITEQDLIYQLEQAYQSDVDAYRIAMVNKLSYDESFFDNVVSHNESLFSNLAKAYGTDIKNWKSLAQAKKDIDQALIQNLGKAWGKYYDVVIDSITGMASLVNKTPTTGLTAKESVDLIVARTNAEAMVNSANQAKKAMDEAAKIQVDIPDFGGIGSSSIKNKSGGSGSSSDTKQTIDWIERLLDVLQKKIDQTKAKFENLFTLKDKKNNLTKQIRLTKNLLTATEKSADRYLKAANKVGLSKSLKKKVKNGSYDINDYSSETAEKIQKYENYYDKYKELKQQADELETDIRSLRIDRQQLYVDQAEAKIAKSQAYAELDSGNYKEQNKHLEAQKKYTKEQYKALIQIAKLKGDTLEVDRLRAEKQKELNDLTKQEFDNIANTYDNKIGLNNNKIQAFQDQISLLEARGQQVGSALYTKQMSLNNVNEEKLIAERAKLIQKLAKIPKGKDSWYEAQDKLFAVDQELTQIQIDNANLQKSINQLKFDRFDDLLAKLNEIVDETDFLIDMLDSENFFDDNGKITDDGITAMGMYAQKYDMYLAEAQKYKEQMAELERDYQSGYVDTDTYEAKMREYKSGQQDMIRSANDAKKSLVSLVKEGLDAQNKALEEAIQKQKDLLSEQQKARNLNQTLEDQNKRIARLKKQLAVLDADDSESARKTKRQLQSELDDLLKEQENTLYDQSIEDQEKSLDELLENSEKQASDYLKNSEVVFVDALNKVNANTETVSKNIERISKETGVDISENITNAWKQSGNAVSDFGTTVSSTMPGVLSQISLVTEQMRQLAEQSEKAAKSLVKDTVDDYTDYTSIGADNNGSSSQSNTGAGTSSVLGTASPVTGNIIGGVLTGMQMANKTAIASFISNNKKDPVQGTKYASLNQYLLKKYGGVLSKSDEAKLAALLGVDIADKALTGEQGRKDLDKILAALKNIGFSTGGVIDPHDILKRTGEKGYIIANPHEAVLTEPQWESIRDLGTTLTNMNQQIYKPYIPEFQTRNTQSPVYNIDSSITVDGVATNEIVKDMANVAKKQAENVITEINRRTYAKGVRWK